MAATIQCLARSNQSRRVIRATKDTNGHWTVGTAERPFAVRPASDLRCTVGAPHSSGKADAMSFLAKNG